PWPLVATCTVALPTAPLIRTSADAFTVTVPVEVQITRTVRRALASVVVVAQVPPVIAAPGRALIVELTVTPHAGPNPEPASLFTVTVNVCAVPTGLTPDVPIVICASTHVFWFEMLNAP